MTQHNFCGRTRREFLWQTGAGFTGTALAGMLGDDFFASEAMAADGETPFKNPLAPKPPIFAPKAKSVIFLFMYGGPSHIDTFDYKPAMIGRDNQDDQGQNVRPRRQEEQGPHRRAALEVQAIRRVRQVGQRSVSAPGDAGRRHRVPALDVRRIARFTARRC